MARGPSARGVKFNRSYTVDEAATVIGACKGTVRRWLKRGLPAITDHKPVLILGGDLIDFLKGRTTNKHTCRLHECFCFSCRKPRAPAFGAVEYFPFSATSGNLRALCETCATIMYKRMSSAKLDRLRAHVEVTVRQDGEHIGDSPKPSLNDHLRAEPRPHA